MESSEKLYTGIEVNFVELIFKRLNLTAQYKVSPKTKDSYYRMFMSTIGQLETASSDIAIGFLPLYSGTVQIAEATFPYFHMKISWYIPCPNPVSHWKSIFKILGSLTGVSFCAVAVLAVIIMWLLAKYEAQIHVRESENYKKIGYCIYNTWAVLNGVSVTQKPMSNSLRIFFIAWVWYSFAMTTVYQGYFFGLLVNPGFDKSLTTLKDLIQSGTDYGYPVELDTLIFSDPLYSIIATNRKICKSFYKCLQRVIERKDFATILDNFHAEYFRTKLLFHNVHVHICNLEEDVMILRASLYIAKGNPLFHRLNEIITHMFEAGLFVKWQNDFMSSSRSDDHSIDDDDDDDEADTKFSDFTTNELNTDYSPISLFQLQVVFHILLIVHIFSTFVWLVEVLCYRACITAATSTTLYRAQLDHYVATS